jgi:methylenetetrahydrofolate reductase (NADPH)
MCGAVFPERLASRLEAVQDNPESQFQIGVDYAVEQCQQLVAAGAPGIHFYALNRSPACERILDSLSLEAS